MSHTGPNYKPFVSTTSPASTTESNMASNRPSGGAGPESPGGANPAVCNSEPVQEDTQHSISKLVPSTTYPKRAESMPVAGNMVPTLESAEFGAGGSGFQDPTQSLLPTESLSPSTGLGQQIGRRNEGRVGNIIIVQCNLL